MTPQQINIPLELLCSLNPDGRTLDELAEELGLANHSDVQRVAHDLARTHGVMVNEYRRDCETYMHVVAEHWPRARGIAQHYAASSAASSASEGGAA